MSDRAVLVIGATGQQGGASARALVADGFAVSALVRNEAAPAAQALAAIGVRLIAGDLDDAASVERAVAGHDGVFMVLRPDPLGSDIELAQGRRVIAAARAAGVRQFVYTSVCQAGTHESFPGWDQGYWPVAYWTHKWALEQAVGGAGFDSFTILRPCFIMANLTAVRAQVLFPQLRDGHLLSPVLPDATIQLIAPEDVGAFACAAFRDPARFDGAVIELASDEMTMDGIAQTLGQVLGRRVEHRTLPPAEAVAAGIPATWVRSQEWTNAVGYRVDRSLLPAYGIALTPLADWVARHAAHFAVG
jgi:uncharacterized protein YbjT (DUF2867 family)